MVLSGAGMVSYAAARAIWKAHDLRHLSTSCMNKKKRLLQRSSSSRLSPCYPLVLTSTHNADVVSISLDFITRGKSSVSSGSLRQERERKSNRLQGISHKFAMHILDKLQNNPVVRIKDPAAVQAKIQKIIHDGYDKLLVISDFDYTLSRFHDADGKRCLTTHGIFDECTRELHPVLADKLQQLVKKYIPIEFCPTMSMEEKIPHMEDWWRLSHQYIVESKFTYEEIEGFVSKAPIHLRDAAVEFVRSVEAHNVPLVIFSAGIGNIIEIILKKNLGHVPQTLHVISNCMNFDENNVCVSFTEPLIHTFCKNSSVITGERPYFQHVKNRTNLILVGDSLGDIHMDVGMVKEGCALKIGYLNWDFDRLYDRYLQEYDIVLLDCQSMEIPLEIFRFCGLAHAPSEVNLQEYCHSNAKIEKNQSEDDLTATNVSA